MKGRSERGAALVLGVIIAILVTGLGGLFIADAFYRSKTASSFEDLTKARVLADAGLDKARRALYYYKANEIPGKSWNEILDYCRTYGTTNLEEIKQDFLTRYENGEYYFEAQYGEEYPGLFTGDELEFARNNYYPKGGYYVYVRDNDDDLDDQNPDDDGDGFDDEVDDSDDVLIVTVTVTLLNGVQKQIEAVVRYNPGEFEPTAAVTAGKSLDLSGNATITGTNGSVHANGDLLVTGSVSLTGMGTAAGVVDITGKATAEKGFFGGVPKVQIPKIDPLQFLEDNGITPDYVLSSDGKIYTGSGTLVFDASGGGEWEGLKFTGSSIWKVAGDSSPPPGVYLVYGPFEMAGSAAMQATILAVNVPGGKCGSVTIEGRAELTPYLPDLLVLAEGDIKMTGHGSMPVNGFLAAHEQVTLTGNANLVGAIVAEDDVDYDDTVSTKTEISAEIEGNAQGSYDGELSTWLPAGGSVGIVAYREIR
jgi:hypothetical protein